MNLAELSRIDIKDLQKIDYKKLIETARKRSDIVLNVVIVLVTLLLAINIMSKSGKKIRDIKKEISKLDKKITAINNLDTVKAELEEFKNSIPETVGEDELATMLTDWAVSRNINIISVSPVKINEEDLYDTISINLDIETNDYAKLWLFAHDIETSPYALRIDHWQIARSGQFKYTSGPVDPELMRLAVTTTITAVDIKNE